MYKVKVALFFFFSTLVGTLYSQTTASVGWDAEQTKFEGGFIDDLAVLKSTPDHIYYKIKAYKSMLTSGVVHCYIVKYDRKNADYTSFDLTNYDGDNEKLNFLNCDTLGGKIHSIRYFHNKKTKKLYLFAESFDYVNMKADGEMKKISEIDLAERGSLVDKMFVYFNNGRMLFRYACEDKHGKFYGLEVFDSKLEREWGTYEMASTEKGYNVESNYVIDNEGNVYGIQRNFVKESDVFRHFDRSRIWAVCYKKSGGAPVSLPLILKNDYFVTSAQIGIDSKNQLICAGLFAKPGTESAVGSFSFVIEPKLAKLVSVQTTDFTLALITKGSDEKKKDKDLRDIVEDKDYDKKFGYKLNEIYFHTDGSFDLVAEKYYAIFITRNDITTKYYYFDDLWVLNYNADGSSRWIQKIPKYEYVQNFYYDAGGYYLKHRADGSMKFIFNLINFKKKFLVEKPFGTTVSITLDKAGNESFNELITDNDISTTFVPKYTFAEDDNNYILIRSNNVKTSIPFFSKHNNLVVGRLGIAN